MTWNLRLRSPKGAIHAVKFNETESFSSFIEYAKCELQIAADNVIQLSAGFPPKPLPSPAEDVPLSQVLQDHDTVIVSLASVKCNEAHVSVSNRKRTNKKKRGCHSLFTPKKSSKDNTRYDSGYRLGAEQGTDTGHGDDEDFKAKSSCTRAISMHSKEDVEKRLIEAVSHNGKNDLTTKFLTTATRKAVDYQYLVALANARLNAALSNNFVITVLGHSGDESSSQIRVVFKERVRKWTEEIVTMLHAVQLKAIVKYVLISGGETGKEMLKPFNMAQCSPRVFWNIARLFNGDVAAGLASLLPNENWSFLDVRTRKLSEKAIRARENEMYFKPQKKKKKQLRTDGLEINPCQHQTDMLHITTSQKKVEDVQQLRVMRNSIACAALKRLEDFNRLKEADPSVKSSEARLENSLSEAPPVPEYADAERITTVYCDDCNKARILTTDQVGYFNLKEEHWTCEKMNAYGRVGGCSLVDDEVANIAGAKHGALLQQASIHTRTQLASVTRTQIIGNLSRRAVCEINLMEIDDYIEQARLEEITDRMEELIASPGLLRFLEREKLGTPAEIIKTPGDLIIFSLKKYGLNITIEKIDSWKKMAQKVLDEYVWMQEWRSD